MRGGNNRGAVKVTASNRRRRERYTRDHVRDPWGYTRDDAPDAPDEDDGDESDPAR